MDGWNKGSGTLIYCKNTPLTYSLLIKTLAIRFPVKKNMLFLF